jgi:hypothetical protein
VVAHDEQELDATLVAGWRFGESLWLRAALSGALVTKPGAQPVGSRLAASPGVLWRTGAFTWLVSAEVPLTTARAADASLGVSAGWSL